jgi:Zn-finger nucleic acid-binding protein
VKCPVCPDATLLMSDRQGVEIDYCPNCRGVWLDRGELDKLVQLSARHEVAPAAAASRGTASGSPRRDFEDSDFGKRQRGEYRRKSWLSEIFD